MRNPVYLARLFANIETGRFVAPWDELNLHEVIQQMSAIPMQGGALR
jgi:hypothetical protein